MMEPRHAPLGVIERYLTEGISGAISVAGIPRAIITIDPQRSQLALRVPAIDRMPNVVDFENVRSDSVVDGDVVWQELGVTLDDNTDEVYAALCSIADRVQLEGESFADAVEAVLDALAGIVSQRHGLSTERQVGLFGELVVLLALVNSGGVEPALAAWRGPSSEEHDFGTDNYDLEVKTTLSERRVHWISGATQLAPTGDRPLFLGSIQLTRAAVNAGSTLPHLVERVRSRFGDHLGAVNRQLSQLGYRDRDADLYRAKWTTRTAPAFFEIDADFPALTQDRLNGAVPSPERLVEVRYRVDLTGLQAAPPLLTFTPQVWLGTHDQ